VLLPGTIATRDFKACCSAPALIDLQPVLTPTLFVTEKSRSIPDPKDILEIKVDE